MLSHRQFRFDYLMIVQPTEVNAYEEFLIAYERSTLWARAIGIATARHLDSPEEFAHAVIALVPPSTPDPYFSLDGISENSIFHYLRDHPHLLIPSGFDEVRIETGAARRAAIAFQNALVERTGEDPNTYESTTARLQRDLEFPLGIHLRDAASGAWYKGARLDLADYSLHLTPQTRSKSRKHLKLREILANCRAALSGDSFPAVILLPRLWRPPREYESIQVVNVSREIVRALALGEVALQDLSWQQLEDVVAELLRSQGLDVTTTTRSKDGGRDLIARGELIPGEVATMAIEVKQRRVVGVREVRSHIQSNSAFPMLLIATSGRFTAGVVAEKKKPEHFMRLHLRDGEALGEWIRRAVPTQ